MGNWANTLDRWSHRGAVVLSPRTRTFAVRAEAFPAWAFYILAARFRRLDLTGAHKATTCSTTPSRRVCRSTRPGSR